MLSMYKQICNIHSSGYLIISALGGVLDKFEKNIYLIDAGPRFTEMCFQKSSIQSWISTLSVSHRLCHKTIDP